MGILLLIFPFVILGLAWLGWFLFLKRTLGQKKAFQNYPLLGFYSFVIVLMSSLIFGSAPGGWQFCAGFVLVYAVPSAGIALAIMEKLKKQS